MKQHITLDQFHELTDDQKGRLWQFAMPKKYLVTSDDKQTIYPLLSIGQMIEFLIEKNPYPWITKDYENFSISWFADEDLCDKLWGEVKKELK